jgi:hypothetical protein
MAQFEEVKKYMADFTSAVGKIKLPEFPEIPSFPEINIPETNLEPLTALVQSIQEQLASKEEMPSNVIEMPQKEEWTFNVKRNQAGFIKTVEATRG